MLYYMILLLNLFENEFKKLWPRGLILQVKNSTFPVTSSKLYLENSSKVVSLANAL